jgi:hypothetical protein
LQKKTRYAIFYKACFFLHDNAERRKPPMEPASIKTFEKSRGTEEDRYAGQVKACPYPPGGQCFLAPEMPGDLWCSAKKCWLFGQHLQEWAEAHPIAKNRITYTDAEIAEMLAYARRRGETTGARYAGK